MILYIVRHSDAVPSGTPGIPEDERPLTDKGIKKMREIAREDHLQNRFKRKTR